MIVEPVPAGRRTGRRRALARIALAVPVLLLVSIAGAGVLYHEEPRATHAVGRRRRHRGTVDGGVVPQGVRRW